MSLTVFFAVVLGGSFALGPVMYQAIEQWDLFSTLEPKWRRLAIASICALIGLDIWVLAAWLGFAETLTTRTALAEAVWTHGIMTGFTAFTGSTILHGFRKDES